MIWLTGKSGLLGQEVEQMLKRGHYDYLGTGHDVDITSADAVMNFAEGKKIDWIINCAAYTAVDIAETERESAYRLNRDGVILLTQIAMKHNAKIIQISTDYIFNGKKDGTYIETDLPCPLGIYGKSKYEGELAVLQWEKSFVLRTSWLFGIGKGNFVQTMLNLFTSQKQVQVVKDQFGVPTFTKDLAEIINVILRQNSCQYGIYHCSNAGERVSWFDFASEIMRQAKQIDIFNLQAKLLPITTNDYLKNKPNAAPRPANSWLSTEKIQQTFKLSLPTWQNGLQRYLQELENERKFTQLPQML